MANGGYISCEQCTYSRSRSRKCDVYGIDTSPFMICRMFRLPKQSHTDARSELPFLNELKSGVVYGFDNGTYSTGHGQRKPLFKVVSFDEY